MNKMKKFMKACPLAVCLLISWAVVATAEHLPLDAKETPAEQTELAGGQEIQETEDLAWEDAEPESDNADHAISENETDKTGQDGSDGADSGNVPDSPGTEAGNKAEETSVSDNAAAEYADTEEKPQKIRPEYLTYEKKKTDSPWYTDPGKIPQTTESDYQKGKNDYFDDAVFIGDSRIVGMNDYSGLTNATFFAKTGLTVYNLLDEEFVKDPETGKEVSVSYMMQHHQYGKIYLMVGINELGTGGPERFAKAYKEVLKKFRKWQPDAVIHVQSIMGVSPKKDKTDPVFNSTNIRNKNYAISRLTDGIHIFYLNIQEIYEDKNHNLAQDLTFDDVHLYAQHYDKWVKYLKTHAVVKGE